MSARVLFASRGRVSPALIINAAFNDTAEMRGEGVSVNTIDTFGR